MTAPPALTVEQRTSRGATWLDEHRPGWVDRINLDTLDLGDPCQCVLGQEWGDYYLAPAEVRGDDDEAATWYGFQRDFEFGDEIEGEYDDAGEYVALTEAWRALILARRGGAS